ncbi:MAG: hypothetical protein DRJ47_00615 [Thermoprotei archaeon]|nr:MAG: hypothetical protein DRJ47_00615 [Thermoprotei archaeon]
MSIKVRRPSLKSLSERQESTEAPGNVHVKPPEIVTLRKILEELGLDTSWINELRKRYKDICFEIERLDKELEERRRKREELSKKKKLLETLMEGLQLR